MAKTSIIKETRDILKEAVPEAKKHWGDPPDGQVPVNDSGWYTSPNLQSNKGVDPRNCEQWPSSPYCGGNPWSKTLVGLDVDWGVGKCGAWVEVEPILVFTKLPPVSVGWRPPGECREEKKPQESPPDPENIDESRPVDPLDLPPINPEAVVCLVIVQSYHYSQVYDSPQISSNPGNTINQWNESLVDVTYPIVDTVGSVVPSYKPYDGRQINVPALAAGKIQKTISTKIDRRNEKSATQVIDVAKAWIASDQEYPQIPNFQRYTARKLNTGAYPLRNGLYFITQFYIPGELNANQRGGVIIYGKFKNIAADWQGFVVDEFSSFNYGQTIYRNKEEYKVAYSSIPDIRKQPPPPNNNRKKDCCMQCCSGGNQAANKRDQDNAEILRLLRKIDRKMGEYPFNVSIFDADENKQGAQAKKVNVVSVADGQRLSINEQEKTLKIIGIDKFPVLAPSSIVNDESHGLLGDLGDLKNKIFKQRIESIAELLNWKIKNDHEIHGQWQEYIEIQDSDPTQKGNQPKKIVLPNMARSFRELVLLNSIQIKTTGIILDTVLKLYIDIANTKVTTATTEAIVRDIQDFLDYPTIEKNLDVPLGIRIPANNDSPDDKEDLNRFLSPSHVKAKFDDWTGEGSIHDMLVVLLDAASMIKATFYNKA